jgi:predicted dehydrogenase
LSPKGARELDAIVFYDMRQNQEPQWRGIKQLLAEGKGVAFLHHSLWFYDGTCPNTVAYWEVARRPNKEFTGPVFDVNLQTR